ncbi:MAG: MFS transporter [Candidatus Aminicenantes bacterium]|nr:MFS transporter [Candidatus Aminicenantes bacterium]
MPNRKVVLLVATVAAFVAPFMSSSINIALPSIAQEFRMTAVTLGWVATAYLLAAAACLVPFGKAADILGRKKIFVLGSLVYALSSGLAAAAPSGAVLIASRALQGIGGAMIFSTGVAMLTAAYPPRERGRVLGINTASTYLGLSLGPVLGGFLTEGFGWRSVFGVNLALGLVLVGLALAGLRGEAAEARGEAFDAVGAALLAAGLCALMFGLGKLPRIPGAGFIAAGAVFLALFVRWESAYRSPLFDLDLIRRNTAFAFSNLAALINYSATFAAGFLLSLYLQYLQGLSPRKAGLILIAQPAVMAVFSPLAGRLSDRVEPRLLASAGMGLSSVGLFLLSFLGRTSSLTSVGASLVVLGIGFALFSSPNTNAVMSSVEKRSYGVASATLGTARLTGMMLSMGAAMLVFALYLGKTAIMPEVFPRYLAALRTAFVLFGALCAAGVFVSLARGNLNEAKGGNR